MTVPNKPGQIMDMSSSTQQASKKDLTVDCAQFEFMSAIQHIVTMVQAAKEPGAIGSAIFDLNKQYDQALAFLDSVPHPELDLQSLRDQYHEYQEFLNERRSAFKEYQALVNSVVQHTSQDPLNEPE